MTPNYDAQVKQAIRAKLLQTVEALRKSLMMKLTPQLTRSESGLLGDPEGPRQEEKEQGS